MNLVRKTEETRPFYSNLFDDFLNTGLMGVEERRGVPALNVKEDDKEVTLEVRLPGWKREDIKLDYRDGVLTISGERKEEKEEKEGKNKYVRREFASYSFHRCIELSEGKYNVGKADASYKDGILEVKIPKIEQKGKVSKTITVK